MAKRPVVWLQIYELSPSERRLMDLLQAGRSYKQIAEVMGFSESCARMLAKRTMSKFQMPLAQPHQHHGQYRAAIVELYTHFQGIASVLAQASAAVTVTAPSTVVSEGALALASA